MNSPETPIDIMRRKPETRTGPRTEGSVPAGEFEPRYVDVPRRRRAQLAADRNLKWGLAVLFVTLGLIGTGLIVAGPRALVPIVICLITLTVLWAMARLRVFHQRNGVFFATAMVCLLGATVPILERGYVELDRMAHDSSSSAPVAVAETKAAPAPAKAPEPPPVAAFEPDSNLPSLVEALKIAEPTDPAAILLRIVERTKVTVGRKPYLLNAGDTFIFDKIENGQVFFRANELRLFVPERAVELMAPASTEPALASEPPAASLLPAIAPRTGQSRVSDRDLDGGTTARAQEEAVRRYPGIGVKGSPENALFVEQYQKLKQERPEFFEDEEWPLFLAEGVAKEHSWIRTTK